MVNGIYQKNNQNSVYVAPFDERDLLGTLQVGIIYLLFENEVRERENQYLKKVIEDYKPNEW